MLIVKKQTKKRTYVYYNMYNVKCSIEKIVYFLYNINKA